MEIKINIGNKKQSQGHLALSPQYAAESAWSMSMVIERERGNCVVLSFKCLC
jgi:hypothetical protein